MAALSQSVVEPAVPTEPLTHRKILQYFTPLAMSWIFMSVEAPVSVAVISRLPSAKINTAAFLIMMGMALWIESPVIDLLSTSTTLAKSRQSYARLSQFTWYIIGWVTLAHALIVLSPLYWFVTDTLLGVEREVAEHARLGLAIMLPWSGLIGWRRYLQGILIRNGVTKLIGIGTAMRVVSVALASGLLYCLTPLQGTVIAGVALISGVGAEALFIHIASRPTINKAFGSDVSQPDEGDLSIKRLMAFHLPLTATTMLTLSGSLLISAGVARTYDSVAALAALQISNTLFWLMRTTVFALPEIVITLYKDEQSARKLRQFCLNVGLVSSSCILALYFSGLDQLFFVHLLGARQDLAALAHLAFLAGLLAPLLGALQSYVRGMLTAHHLTVSRLFAVAVSTTAIIVALAVGVAVHMSGAVLAGLALSFALAAELVALVLFWRGSRTKKPLIV